SGEGSDPRGRPLAGPVLVTPRLACDVPGESVSVALSLAGFVSVAPAAATVAVLARGPLAPGASLQARVRVSTWPAPGARLAFVMLTALPDEALVPQPPLPLTT